MKFILVTFVALNLAVGGWANPIEDSAIEDTSLIPADAIKEDQIEGRNGLGLRNVCNETIVMPSGSITTPNFPQNYVNNMSCYWLIVGESNSRLSLTFESFLLESGWDFLRIFDGPSLSSPLLAKYTGYTVPPDVTSSGNTLLLHFSTDISVVFAGFSSRFSSYYPSTTTTTTLPPSPDCGGVLVNYGYFQSPSYPYPYPSNSNCTWFLQSSSQTAITLRFDQFVTENKADYVAIFEGWNTPGKDPVVYSGNLATPFTYSTTSTNKLTVRFVADSSVEVAGFKAYFS